MEPVTPRFIARASYATLTQLCKQMGVTFQNQPKQKIQELLIEKLGSQAEKTPTPISKITSMKIIEKKPIPVKNARKAKRETISKAETKSSKILAMHLKGKKVSEISEALKAHPSFIYTVINKHKESKSK